jgi:hypothetical protein
VDLRNIEMTIELKTCEDEIELKGMWVIVTSSVSRVIRLQRILQNWTHCQGWRMNELEMFFQDYLRLGIGNASLTNPCFPASGWGGW